MLHHDLAPILATARDLQEKRIQEVFRAGFKLPSEICGKYFQRYLLECKSCADPVRCQNAYSELYRQFWEQVGQTVCVPIGLNNLDLATLFGEVCLGQHTEERSLYIGGNDKIN